MPTSYTSLIGLALPVTGELSGTWGDTVNNYITNYLDSAVAGTQTISGTQTAVTLSVTNGSSLVTAGSGSTGSAQFQIINCTGNPAGLLTITAPASSRQYIIINATSTSQSVKIVGAGPTTGVTLISGEKAHVAWNGSDFVKIATQSGNGSFVDLTVSGSMTLSGGTANGVLYLNGSKVATSGSALTFDGTNFATTGTASATKLIPTGGAATGNGMYLPAANTLAWSNNGSETMRLDSSGDLRVGTTSSLSVADKLTVVGGNIAVRRTSGITTFIGDNTVDGYAGTATNHAFALLTNSTERARIDTSGNLGLGVTPSGWGAFKALSIGTAGNSIAGFVGANSTVLTAGTFYNGTNWVYTGASSSPAMQFAMEGSNKFVWYQNTSTGANNTYTPTATMTLDASGNLGVGTTSPNYLLHLNGTPQIQFTNSTTGTTTGDGAHIYLSGSDWWLVNKESAAMVFATNNSERARITSEGNLLVGTTSKLSPTPTSIEVGVQSSVSAEFTLKCTKTGGINWSINSGSASSAGTGFLSFYDTTAAAERARITSGGDLLVGGTAQHSNERLSVAASSTNQALYTKNNSTDYNFNCWNAATTGDNPFVQFITETVATSRGGITYNRGGGLVAYNTTSDYRAKDIIGPVQNPGATIDALKVYEGKMKGATQSRPMLVAHEAQQHTPYAVTGEKDAVNEDGTPKFQQMDVSSLVPLLLAEIQSLRARVAQLESKGA